MSINLTDEEIKKRLEDICFKQRMLYKIGYKYRDIYTNNRFYIASCNYYKFLWRQLAKTKKILKAEQKKRRRISAALENVISALFESLIEEENNNGL